jgi:hypothetical protein
MKHETHIVYHTIASTQGLLGRKLLAFVSAKDRPAYSDEVRDRRAFKDFCAGD